MNLRVPEAPTTARLHRGSTRLETHILVAIFAGGCGGTLVRAGVAELLPRHAGAWPWATFLVNVAGAAILGWAAARWPPQARRRSFVGTGFCGALTTFSALQIELLDLLDAGHVGIALSYGGASLGAGLGAAYAGANAARRRRGR